ncbi:hypothetical protein FPANT_13337 [Fusarium pseudoanthophilum]|uniref:2EXR domain-containing protein n=1 Tax=Fusarium pseudoanthophilum TaxID=48495 RepID=A0A8H5NNI6_9HYPO|nr:hypothetical protein FPANT_13337 [Fusarium pseudoanthophilum]
MFQLVKKLFKRQSPNSGNDSDNEPKGAFHRFGQLPQEIQNLIWAYAICVDAPRAYFVDVKDFPNWPQELRITHSTPASLGSFPLPPASNPKSDYNLMRVCRASYHEITRCWTLYQPQVPARMRLENVHDNATRVKEESYLHIDGASDLVIVERWCHNDTWISRFQDGVEIFGPPFPFSGLEAIRRVALPIDMRLSYYSDSCYLKYLKAVFPGLHTLYFYMKPAELVSLAWRHRGMPVDLLAAKPVPDEEPPESFRARGRIFYELCPEAMKRAGIETDYHVSPWLRSRRRWRGRPNGIACIKFITWKWIQ